MRFPNNQLNFYYGEWRLFNKIVVVDMSINGEKGGDTVSFQSIINVTQVLATQFNNNGCQWLLEVKRIKKSMIDRIAGRGICQVSFNTDSSTCNKPHRSRL